jgi:hypothetical protein
MTRPWRSERDTELDDQTEVFVTVEDGGGIGLDIRIPSCNDGAMVNEWLLALPPSWQNEIRIRVLVEGYKDDPNEFRYGTVKEYLTGRGEFATGNG